MKLVKALSKTIALATVVAALGASADVVNCGDSLATVGNATYVDCQGPTGGNIAPNQTNTATFGLMTFPLIGKSDDMGFGPFTSALSGTSGTATFDVIQFGMFVIGIKGGPGYSLYLFDAPSGVTTINWDTFGIVTGSDKAGPDLSHLALFRKDDNFPPSGVPAPATLALLGVGLAGVSLLRRRKS